VIGRYIPYSEEELRFVKRFCKLPRKELAERFNAKFERDVSVLSLAALRRRKGWLTGRTGRFVKGRASWNKGVTGYMGANSTSFKPGSVPARTNPLWAERVNPDGYIEIKVPETNLHTGAPTRYILKHHWLWKQEHAGIPKGAVLKFKDGNKKNCTLENLVLIDRALLPALNRRGYDNAADECKPLILNVCKLQQTIGGRKKERL